MTTALVSAAAAGLVAVLAASSRPALRSVLHAAAAGVCFGTTSAMIAIAIALFPVSVEGVVLAGLAAAGLVTTGATLLQMAYRDGGLGGPLATLTLVDPLVASVIGVVVVGERFVGGPGAVAIAVAGAVAVAGGLAALVRRGPPPRVACSSMCPTPPPAPRPEPRNAGGPVQRIVHP